MRHPQLLPRPRVRLLEAGRARVQVLPQLRELSVHGLRHGEVLQRHAEKRHPCDARGGGLLSHSAQALAYRRLQVGRVKEALSMFVDILRYQQRIGGSSLVVALLWSPVQA